MLIKKSGFEVIAKIDTLSKKSLKQGSFAILVFFVLTCGKILYFYKLNIMFKSFDIITQNILFENSIPTIKWEVEKWRFISVH